MKSYGFIKEEVENEAYVFGGGNISIEVLQEDGQWINFLPEYEPQSNDQYDTDGCTIFGTINACEILMKRKWGIDANYSERFLYNLIPVRPPGGSPQSVAQAIRDNGMVHQSILPMTDTFDEYTTPTPITDSLKKEASKWLESYELKHDVLWKVEPNLADRNKILKEALKHSPVGVSVSAWILDGETYVDQGRPNNHWCVCVGYEEIGDDLYPIVFDSYDHSIKKLDKFHHVEMAKGYYIFPAQVKKKKGVFQTIIDFIMGLKYRHA